MRPNLTPAGVRRLLTFVPATASVRFGEATDSQSVTILVSYYYFEGLFRQIHQLHLARGFRPEPIRVTMQDGRSFDWNAELSLQCFSRRKPKYDKLLALVPQM